MYMYFDINRSKEKKIKKIKEIEVKKIWNQTFMESGFVLFFPVNQHGYRSEKDCVVATTEQEKELGLTDIVKTEDLERWK